MYAAAGCGIFHKSVILLLLVGHFIPGLLSEATASASVASAPGNGIPRVPSSIQYPEKVNVTYDSHSFIINGERRLLFGASMHYWRSTPAMWPSLLKKAKAGGVDLVQTYVYWGGHEPVRGQWVFEGRYDLARFLRLASEAGLQATVRIGPFIAAAVELGGFPYWLEEVPGIQPRTDNVVFEAEMKRYVGHMMAYLSAHGLLARQGGPIILMEIENEYSFVEANYGAAGRRYIKWAAELALGAGAGVPWFMSRMPAAPVPGILTTCNDFYCCGKKRTAGMPGLWTESYTGWHYAWGCCRPHRPPQDHAFAVAYWFATGGTYVSFYMYHGGTNFDRTSTSPTSFDYDGPLDEYGLEREPKYSHLRALMRALKQSAAALLSDAPPVELSLAPSVEAYVFGDGAANVALRGGGLAHANDAPPPSSNSPSLCAAFLVNLDVTPGASTVVVFGVKSFELPAWSVSILPDCRTEAFNSAIITAQGNTVRRQIIPASSSTSSLPAHTGEADAASSASSSPTSSSSPLSLPGGGDGRPRRRRRRDLQQQQRKWLWHDEAPGVTSPGGAIFSRRPLDHLSLSKDHTPYVWYQTRVQVSPGEWPGDWPPPPPLVTTPDSDDNNNNSNGNGNETTPPPLQPSQPALLPLLLRVTNLQDPFHVVVNGELVGSFLKMKEVAVRVDLRRGASNTIALLPLKLQLLVRLHLETVSHTNFSVLLESLPAAAAATGGGGAATTVMDLTGNGWLHRAGLEGEGTLNAATAAPPSSLNGWSDVGERTGSAAAGRPLTWLATSFATPGGTRPLAVDLGSMGSGYLWVNGAGLGRYWPSLAVNASACAGTCSPGIHTPFNCQSGGGRLSQRWYHIPRDVLREGEDNTLVLFEEVGGDPARIRFALHMRVPVDGSFDAAPLLRRSEPLPPLISGGVSLSQQKPRATFTTLSAPHWEHGDEEEEEEQGEREEEGGEEGGDEEGEEGEAAAAATTSRSGDARDENPLGGRWSLESGPGGEDEGKYRPRGGGGGGARARRAVEWQTPVDMCADLWAGSKATDPPPAIHSVLCPAVQRAPAATAAVTATAAS